MDSKLQELVKAATEKTSRGQLRWKAVGSDTFYVAIGNGQLTINRVWNWSDESDPLRLPAYSVSVNDSLGRTVAESDVKPRSTGYGEIATLFQTARNTALGSEQVLEDMIGALQAG